MWAQVSIRGLYPWLPSESDHPHQLMATTLSQGRRQGWREPLPILCTTHLSGLLLPEIRLPLKLRFLHAMQLLYSSVDTVLKTVQRKNPTLTKWSSLCVWSPFLVLGPCDLVHLWHKVEAENTGGAAGRAIAMPSLCLRFLLSLSCHWAFPQTSLLDLHHTWILRPLWAALLQPAQKPLLLFFLQTEKISFYWPTAFFF
jgi:hypothetical protein